MKLYPRVVLFLLLVVLLSASGVAWCSASVPDDIGACLNQPDGSRVTLPSEQVIWRGRSGKSFAIKEWTEKQPPLSKPRLVVVSTKPLPVEEYWTVDVTGVLSTLPGTSKDGSAIQQRVLIVTPDSVSVYCDSKGRPFLFPGLKGMGMEWANKRTLIELAGESTVQSASMSTMDAGTLPPMEDSPDSEPTPPAPGSRDSLKWLPDGAPVSVNGAIVSASFSDYGFFYVEKSDRSFGIWISAPDYMYEGQLVDITGRMGTGGGERAVIADQGGVNVADYNTYPRPTELGMPNKHLGGGAVGLFTPAVSDAAGLNNTGLLVRAWGKVTYVDSQNRIYYINDGSDVTADAGHVGVKVYDLTYDPLPAQDSYQIVSGVSAAEWPQGASSSIRVVWKTSSVTPATQAGSGTISGTITATGADGKTVKVYCASGSTTATFSGNTANYTLAVPYGSHAVTVSMLGYKTITQLATVNSGTPVDLDFTMPALQRRIDIVASPERIPPDGTSQMTITAIVRDEEGRRFGNESVTWDVDLGTVISSDTTTDAVGEARLVLQAPSTPGTANVSVTVGGTTATNYAEFASPTAPSVRILEPVVNDILTGTVTVKLQVWDYYGAKPGVTNVGVSVDNQPLGSASPTRPQIVWQTYYYGNGTHIIRAAVADGDQETGFSQAVAVTTSNDIYGLNVANGMFDANDSDPAKRTTTITAYQQQATDWEIEFKKQGASSPARVFTGNGTTINATWDGTDSGGNPVPPGQYGVTIRAGATQGLSADSFGFSLWDYIVFLRSNIDAPTALLVEGYPFSYSSECLHIVEDACERRGFQVITIPYKYATWERFHFYFNVFEPEVFYINTHGDYEIRSGQSCLPSLLPQISRFMLKDSWVNSFRPQDNQGNYFPEYPPAGDNAYERIKDPVTGDPATQYPDMYAHYLSELGLTYYSPLKLVWMDNCLNGRIGSLYGDLSDQFNPYAVDMYGANDNASMFGIYDNAWTIGASYCGFFELSFDDERYKNFLGRIFGSLAVGYSLDQAITRDAWNDGRFDRQYPDGIDMNYGPSPGMPSYGFTNPCNNWRVPMPPYHNLRVHGNPWSTYLTP
jgi:hypothetical protein